MTQICVELLCSKDIIPIAQSLVQKFEEDTELDNILDPDNPLEGFLAYSAEHWPRHLQDAHIPKNDPFMAGIFLFYDADSAVHSQWFPIFWMAVSPDYGQPKMNSIRLAAVLGHEKVLELMLQSDKGYNLNESDNDGHTALMWASQFGHEAIVQMRKWIG
jgi:hypothetical protein